MEKNLPSRKVVEEAVLSAFIELLSEVKRANRSNENMIMRDIKSLHGNTTSGDLPDYLKKALNNVTHSTMGYIAKHGYYVAPIEKAK